MTPTVTLQRRRSVWRDRCAGTFRRPGLPVELPHQARDRHQQVIRLIGGDHTRTRFAVSLIQVGKRERISSRRPEELKSELARVDGSLTYQHPPDTGPSDDGRAHELFRGIDPGRQHRTPVIEGHERWHIDRALRRLFIENKPSGGPYQNGLVAEDVDARRCEPVAALEHDISREHDGVVCENPAEARLQSVAA
jgi:hypothetical protein